MKYYVVLCEVLLLRKNKYSKYVVLVHRSMCSLLPDRVIFFKLDTPDSKISSKGTIILLLWKARMQMLEALLANNVKTAAAAR